MSETLHVVATIPTDPQAGAAISAGVAALVAATREEEGCLAYSAYESVAVPGVWVTVEEWRSQADLDLHLKTPHVAQALEQLGPVLTGEIAVHPLRPL